MPDRIFKRPNPGVEASQELDTKVQEGLRLLALDFMGEACDRRHPLALEVLKAIRDGILPDYAESYLDNAITCEALKRYLSSNPPRLDEPEFAAVYDLLVADVAHEQCDNIIGLTPLTQVDLPRLVRLLDAGEISPEMLREAIESLVAGRNIVAKVDERIFRRQLTGDDFLGTCNFEEPRSEQ